MSEKNSLQVATARNVTMSRKTPHVEDGYLLDSNGVRQLALDTSEWFAWLADEAHHSFHYVHPTGGFTARKEHRQRGNAYWVAYRQAHNNLYKTYLGKHETLTEAHLSAASKTLQEAAEES